MASNDHIRMAASLLTPTLRRKPWGKVNSVPPAGSVVARAHAHAATGQAEMLTEILSELKALRVTTATPDDDRVPVFYTADVALFTTIGDTVHVLLIRRGWEPFKGLWALPGGHVDSGETARAAAVRECREETGIRIPGEDLTPIGAWDTPGRDPRGRYVSVLFAAVLDTAEDPTAGDDASAAKWVPYADALTEGLAFDHRSMVETARPLVAE